MYTKVCIAHQHERPKVTSTTQLTLVTELLRLLDYNIAPVGALVLAPHPDVEKTSTDNNERVEGKGDLYTCGVSLQCLLLLEGDRGNDTADTAESDDDCGSEGTLGLSTNSSLRPREDEGDVRVSTTDGEEGSGVTGGPLGSGELRVHDGSDDKAGSVEHDDWATEVPVLVGNVGGDESWDNRPKVGRSVENHALDWAEAHGTQNEGEEVGECVGGHGGSHEEDSKEPDLEVAGVLAHLGPCELVDVGVVTVALDTGLNNVALLLGEEGGAVGEIDDGKDSKDTDDNGHDAEPDEDPLPSRQAADAVHHRDAVAED